MLNEEKLKLGKGVAFVKSRLKRFRQDEDTWEADFRGLPKPIMQTEALEKAFMDYLRQLRDEQRAGMVKPPPEQAKVESNREGIGDPHIFGQGTDTFVDVGLEDDLLGLRLGIRESHWLLACPLDLLPLFGGENGHMGAPFLIRAF
jgi:hypothetical protein